MNEQLNRTSILANIEYHESQIRKLEVELGIEKMKLAIEQKKLQDNYDWGLET